MGLIVGIIEVTLAIAFAALIFSGPLSPFVVNGIGIALAGAILSGVTVALLATVPGTVSGNQDIPSALIAVAAASLALTVPGNVSEKSLYATVVVMIALTTMLTGVSFFVLARFRVGDLVSFLPYPVVGGFLAATGWVLVLGGIGVMVDVSPGLQTLALLLEPAQLMRWAPGLLLAGTVIIVLRRTESPLALPAVIFGSIGLFYGIATIAAYPVEHLLAGGWLLGPFPYQDLWHPPALSDVSLVHWPSIVRQIPNMATVVLMSTIALLLNGSGLELATGKEVGLNRELRAAGIGNVVAGSLGGLVGFQQLSLSALSYKVGRESRLAGIFAAALCALVLLAGASILSLFPKLVVGGLICYLGLSFLQDTVVANWSTLPRGDYAVMMLILLVAATIGFIEAVGVGLLVAVVLFVINYSRIDIVGDELSGSILQSRVTRSPDKCRLLNEVGNQLYILRLQGFIFFGTADGLLARVRKRLEERQLAPVRFLLLDFSDVTGVDTTTIFSFVKLIRLAQQEGLILVLTEPVPGLLDQIEAKISTADAVHVFADLDRGLEWCEEQLLAAAGARVNQDSFDGLQAELTRRVADEDTAARLLSYFERVEVDAGHYLMRQGEAADNLYLMEVGQMSAYLEEKDGRSVRLQTMQDWNVLGEIGFFLDAARTASVVAEAPGVVYCLSRDALTRMRQNDPELSSALHQLIVQLLAERVVHLVSVVDALRR